MIEMSLCSPITLSSLLCRVYNF